MPGAAKWIRAPRAERATLPGCATFPSAGESIRLGQALKLSGLAETGGEARALVEDGVVTVNDEVETRRGRQLRDGDVVAVGGEALRIEASAP